MKETTKRIGHWDLRERIDATELVIERVVDDIHNIIEVHHSKIVNGLMDDISEKRAERIACERVFDVFLHNRLYLYEQTDINRDGILMTFNNEYDYIFRQMEDGYSLQESISHKVQKYFDEFDIHHYINPDNEYAKAILESSGSNPYKQKIYTAALYSLFNEIDETDARIWINSLIGEYYFNEVLPAEDRAIAEKRYRQENDIPDLSNVSEGQQWTGRNRVADFIRAVGLQPKPAGKNSRKAQENSILRSCAFEDNKETQTLTLLEIYPVRRMKNRKERTRKYEPYISLLLLNTLKQCPDGILKTTRPDFLKSIGAIPNTFKKIPIAFYKKVLPSELAETNLIEKDLKYFHEISQERLNNIVTPVLENLSSKSIIRYCSYPVIVTMGGEGKKIYTSIYESEKLGLPDGELKRMMRQAESWAANQIEVEIFDEATQQIKRTKLNNIAEVCKYWKLSQYKKLFDTYIKDQYNWLFTFQQIEISHASNGNRTEVKTIDTAEALNSLLLQAVLNTIKKKISNVKMTAQDKYEEMLQKYTENEEISMLFDSGVYSESDVANKIKVFSYSEDFFERAKYFAKYELSFDKAAYAEYMKWSEDNSL